MKPGKGLTRKTGLTARKGLSSSTGLTRTTGLSTRVPAQRAAPPPPPAKPRQRPSEGSQRAAPVSQAVRDAVYERDQDRCSRCGCPALAGNRSLQHRRPRASGGHQDPHAMSNLLLVHGALGTVGCHGEIEARRPEEYERGYLVRSWDDPARVPVLHALYGWVLLDDDGSVTPL